MAVISQLRTGQSPFNEFLYKSGVPETANCPACNVTESAKHYLIHCKAYRRQSEKFRQALEKKIKVAFNNADRILDDIRKFPYLVKYIEESGRFAHFRTYNRKLDQKMEEQQGPVVIQ